MRLHNRQIKSTFWNDTDIAQWPRDKRWFYEGLIQLADDSGCLEDSPFAFKMHLFPSPMDADITIELLTQWKDELVSEGKLIPYEASNKRCLYLANFHKHQALKNPDRPEVPLPAWITWEPYPSNPRTGKFTVSDDVLSGFLQSSYACLTNVFQPEPEPEEEPKPEPDQRQGDVTVQSAIEEVAAATEHVVSDSKPSLSSEDVELTQLHRIYEAEGFGVLSQMVSEHLTMLREEYTFEWVVQALEEAVLQNKRRLKYVKAILQNWRAEGGIRRSDRPPVNRRGSPKQESKRDPRYGKFYELFPDA